MTARETSQPQPAGRLTPGISTYAFGWAVSRAQPPFDEHALLAFAGRHGLQVVQLADNLPVHTWPADRVDRFVEAAARAGIAIELGARGLTGERLEEYLTLCCRTGARLLRFMPDAHPYEPSAEDLVAIVRNAAGALATAGVTLAIENHDRFPAAVLRRIVERAGTPQAGICLDTANGFGAGEGLEATTRILAPLTVNLHVKDVRISRLPHLMGFVIEGRPLGEGQLPILATIEEVARHGRCTSVILESWTSPAASMRATIQQELAGVEASVGRLLSWLAAAAADVPGAVTPRY